MKKWMLRIIALAALPGGALLAQTGPKLTPSGGDPNGLPGPPAENVDAPPDLFTAIQQQLGLKLESTKAPADVLVIDRVEKPSEN